MYTIDIDIGSTCTDGFFTDGQKFQVAKVLTTPYDLADCTLACIKVGAERFGADLKTFLRSAVVSRLSTTLGTNLIVQRAGTKVGLLVTRGQESKIYGRAEKATILDVFVPAEMVLGIDEEVDDRGQVVKEADREDVLNQVRRLVELGARIIVASFRNSWRNLRNEELVRTYVRERYPVQYLRSVPVQLSVEAVHSSDDHIRANSAVLNAYIHNEMARNLYRIEDRLRDSGMRRPLLVVHSDGGSGRIAKTVALHTLHSGPAVATRGAARLAELLGLDKVLTIDMGGTSLDTAVILGRRYQLGRRPRLEGVELAVPMVEVESIAAGGSTIARLHKGELTVGPRSAGSAPGPACYGRGGTEPTITDANVVLGFIDPQYFLGGTMSLDRTRAERTLEQLGARVKLNAVGMASAIRARVADQVAAKLSSVIKARECQPAEFTMFVLGGNSGLHASLFAERVGIQRLIAFPYCSVFSAFGANTTDIQHRYTRTVTEELSAKPDAILQETLPELYEIAARDMVGEGFSPQNVSATVEFELQRDGRSEWVSLPRSGLDNAYPLGELLPQSGTGGVVIKSMSLLAQAEISHWEPTAIQPASSSESACKGERLVHWDKGGSLTTPIFTQEVLDQPGWKAQGPAIIESPITNYAIAPGWEAEVDQWGNLRLSGI